MEYIFIKYLLVPLIAAVAMAGFALYAKAREALRPGRLLLFILILALVLALPALFGLARYEFVPFGLILTQASWLLLGILLTRFMNSGVFQSIGLEENKLAIFLVLLVAVLLGAWVFYLAFEYLSGLGYVIWVTLAIVWVLFPVFHAWARMAFVKIPPPYYQVWDPMEAARFDPSVWEEVDYLRMMNISLRIKQKTTDREYSSYPVKAPGKIPVAQWFTRYLKDQRVKFPNSPLEIEQNGEPFCWIFYTTRFFIFNRPLAPEKTFQDYRIRNKSVVYARRVKKTETLQ
jgi:hypothetical protein